MARIWPDKEGTYQVMGTPWFNVRYWIEVEVCSTDDDGNESCSTYEETIGWERHTKAPTNHIVDVPIICLGCPIPVMCINGACSEDDLYAIPDRAHRKNFEFDVHSQLTQ